MSFAMSVTYESWPERWDFKIQSGRRRVRLSVWFMGLWRRLIVMVCFIGARRSWFAIEVVGRERSVWMLRSMEAGHCDDRMNCDSSFADLIEVWAGIFEEWGNGGVLAMKVYKICREWVILGRSLIYQRKGIKFVVFSLLAVSLQPFSFLRYFNTKFWSWKKNAKFRHCKKKSNFYLFYSCTKWSRFLRRTEYSNLKSHRNS